MSSFSSERTGTRFKAFPVASFQRVSEEAFLSNASRAFNGGNAGNFRQTSSIRINTEPLIFTFERNLLNLKESSMKLFVAFQWMVESIKMSESRRTTAKG